jgi:hypothetical protein
MISWRKKGGKAMRLNSRRYGKYSIVRLCYTCGVIGQQTIRATKDDKGIEVVDGLPCCMNCERMKSHEPATV